MIPAPPFFVNLREHLDVCGVDISTLIEALQSYLNTDENQISPDGFDDPVTDHQAFSFRETIEDFLESIS